METVVAYVKYWRGNSQTPYEVYFTDPGDGVPCEEITGWISIEKCKDRNYRDYGKEYYYIVLLDHDQEIIIEWITFIEQREIEYESLKFLEI